MQSEDSTTTGGSLITLETALVEQESRADNLLKQGKQLISALKAWKRACTDGDLIARKKHAARAEALCASLAPAVGNAADSWTFDLRAYLDSDNWQKELSVAVSSHPSLPKISAEGNDLICPPLVLRADPARSAFRLGKKRWTKLRAKCVVGELVRIRERGSLSNVQEFLEALWSAVQHLNGNRQGHGKSYDAMLYEIYDMYCCTPGWKKDNSRAIFAQNLYALHSSHIRVTRSGRTLQLDSISGHPKSREVFEVVAEDGRQMRYHRVLFI